MLNIDRVNVQYVHFVQVTIFMQKSIPVSELRQNLATITDEVLQKKTSFVLVKNGKPVAKLVPADAQLDLSPEFAKVVDTVFSEFAADLKKLAETP